MTIKEQCEKDGYTGYSFSNYFQINYSNMMKALAKKRKERKLK